MSDDYKDLLSSLPKLNINRVLLDVVEHAEKLSNNPLLYVIPSDIRIVLLKGEMTKDEYNKLHSFYVNKRALIDWFGSYGIDGRGEYYHYVINYKKDNEVTYKVYLNK